MAEKTIVLQCTRTQFFQFVSHLIVYLSGFALKDLTCEHLRQVLAVTRRLFQPCFGEGEELAEMQLSPEEVRLVRSALEKLQRIYGQWPNSPDTPFALEHLSACLWLLQQAETEAQQKKG